MSKRGMGKVGFVHVSDIDGQIQLFVKKDILGEDEYARFKKLDIGDIIGAEGEVFTTQTGEISVRAEKITLLSKSLLPLPEKLHGMTDTDLRYRQRYIDLIMNADVKKTFINRSKIIASIRSYLNGKTSLKLKHLCLSQTQAVLPQDRLKHTLTHWTKISNFVSHLSFT